MQIQKPRLLVGLGNPGERYGNTRHNIGFRFIKYLSEKLPGISEEMSVANSRIWIGHKHGERIWLQMPLTMMNCSGAAVERFIRKYKLSVRDVLIIYDDLDIPLGRFRFRLRGSSGGHHGIDSVIRSLGTQQVSRLRIGIGRQKDGRQSVIRYVLSDFSKEEKACVEAVLLHAMTAVDMALSQGIIAAMNRYNGMEPHNS